MIVVIDASYFVFYRYFATLRWYSFKNPDITGPDARPMEDAEFAAAFLKHVNDTLAKIRKTWKPERIIMCKDCPRADIWRTELYPEYKGSRVTPSNFDKGAFVAFYESTDAWDVEVVAAPHLEADDLVFFTIQHIRATQGDNVPIVCYSNDNDYLQLLAFPNVTLINLQGKNLATRSCGCPHRDVTLKALLGDKSDNIPPVLAKLGPKTAESLAALTEEERLAQLRAKGGDAAVSRYQFNRTLVDFACIPEALKNDLKLCQKT